MISVLTTSLIIGIYRSRNLYKTYAKNSFDDVHAFNAFVNYRLVYQERPVPENFISRTL